MGRLDCKEPSRLAFETLERLADAFVVVSDAQAERAAMDLDRFGVLTTPSGAASHAAMLADPSASGRPFRPLVIASESRI